MGSMNYFRTSIPINSMIFKLHNFLQHEFILGAFWGHCRWHSGV